MRRKIILSILAALLLSVLAAVLLKAYLGTLRASDHCIAALGDSVTYGAGVKNHREERAWTFLLEDMLGDGWEVINYGQNGATLQAEGDRPYADTGYLAQALRQRAGIYLLMLGANDSKPENWDEQRYVRELRKMVQTLIRGNWAHTLILMKLPWAYDEEPGSGRIRAGIRLDIITEKINPAIEAVAQEFALPCIDLYTLTEGHEEYYKDGLHPNKKGNRVIAEYLFQELQELKIL